MIGNEIVLGAWQVLTCVAVPGRQIKRNTEEMKQAFSRTVRIEPGEYIENQPQLGALKFGRKYDFAYGGCSVIAVYNTLLALGETMSGETLCGISEELQKRGVALGGRLGVAPLSLKRYLDEKLSHKGFVVRSTTDTRPERLDALGTESDSVLVIMWNGKRLRDQFHAMNMEKRADGFIIHNACYLTRQRGSEKGEVCYGEKGPYKSLSAAMRGYSESGRPVLTIGISRRGQTAGGQAE